MIKALPRRKTLTLISAWRCPTGIVLHADSQETVGSYRATVQKLQPEFMDPFMVVVTGSGDGDLVQSFIVRLRRRLQGCADDLQSFVVEAENELAEFYRSDVALSPLSPDEKHLKFIIAAFSPTTRKYDAWVSRNVILERIEKYELAGWEEPLYKNIAQRLYRPEMTIAQAVLAGVYLLSVGEDSSNYIRNPFYVAVVRDNGIHMERAAYIQEMGARLKNYEQLMNHLFLVCADTERLPSELRHILEAFSSDILSLHMKHIGEMIYRMLQAGIEKSNDAHSQIPLGTSIELDDDGQLKGFTLPGEL
jgi:hypothetical protein